jgi:hypothetical protein
MILARISLSSDLNIRDSVTVPPACRIVHPLNSVGSIARIAADGARGRWLCIRPLGSFEPRDSREPIDTGRVLCPLVVLQSIRPLSICPVDQL